MIKEMACCSHEGHICFARHALRQHCKPMQLAVMHSFVKCTQVYIWCTIVGSDVLINLIVCNQSYRPELILSGWKVLSPGHKSEWSSRFWTSTYDTPLEYMRTILSPVHKYTFPIQVEYRSTNASQAQEYRCQSSTRVQMPCQLSCEHKCACGGSHPAATLHHTVKIQCSLERNHWVEILYPEVLRQCQNPIFIGE